MSHWLFDNAGAASHGVHQSAVPEPNGARGPGDRGEGVGLARFAGFYSLLFCRVRLVFPGVQSPDESKGWVQMFHLKAMVGSICHQHRSPFRIVIQIGSLPFFYWGQGTLGVLFCSAFKRACGQWSANGRRLARFEHLPLRNLLTKSPPKEGTTRHFCAHAVAGV